MDNVWLITLLGISTVFLALIFLALVTSLFPLVFGGRTEKKVKDVAPLPELNSPTGGAAPAGAASGMSPEIVAVIAAAVSAASGAAPGSFRIASIAPASGEAGFNTPIWGRIERFARN